MTPVDDRTISDHGPGSVRERVSRLAHGETRYFTQGFGLGTGHGSSTGPSPLVVLLHGYTMGAASLHELAARVAERGCHVLWFDRYGDGLSECPAAEHDPTFFCQQIDEVLADAGVADDQPLTIVGCSLGAVIAAEYARVRAARVAGLALIGPGGCTARLPIWHLFTHPLTAGARAIYLLGRVPVIGELTESTCELFIRHVLDPAVRSGRDDLEVLLGIPPGTARRWVAAFDKPRYAHSVLSTLRFIPMLGDVVPLYEDIGRDPRPVLIIWGTQDAVTPIQCNAVMIEALPRARCLEVRGAGHAPYVTHPRIVADAIVSLARDAA